jgi:HD-like signal output (HDOD) protein
MRYRTTGTMSNSTTSSAVRTQDGDAPAASPQEKAFEFLQSLAFEVSHGTVDLPCFPNVVLRIREALKDPNTTTEHMVTIVGAEPRLAARLLQTANSAAFSPLGKPLTDLRAAILRLGQQLVQSAAMAFAVRQMKYAPALRTIEVPLTALWRESITVASISQIIARRAKVQADEAFLTGLLHGIGRLYIMARAVGKSNVLSEDESWIELVSDWHASIGKAVLENWGFAEAMVAAVGDQGDYSRDVSPPPTLTDVLIASIILADALRQGNKQAIDIEGVTAFETIGLTQRDFQPILTEAEAQLDSLLDALGS